MKIKEIKKKLNQLKKKLRSNGKILIFTLDVDKNEIPTFKTMKQKLNKSLNRDLRILKIIKKLYPHIIKKKLINKVKIKKKNYLEMIKKRYIYTLAPFTKKQIVQGIEEIRLKHKSILKFKDKLICIIL